LSLARVFGNGSSLLNFGSHAELLQKSVFER
jgi:hypothetical protein